MSHIRMLARDLVKAINDLPRNREYHYVDAKNPGRIVLDEIRLPEGPIFFRRYNPKKGQALAKKRRESISTNLLWRVANAIEPNVPVNIDRGVAASYNSRSVLEALLASTPQFHMCKPDRITVLESTQDIRKGHKHLIWKPDAPHAAGDISWIDTGLVISERRIETVYKPVEVATRTIREGETPEQSRRHVQIQYLLIEIAKAFGYRPFIARPDQTITYGTKKLGELDGMIADLRNEPLLSNFSEAASAGNFIDCIWFERDRNIPAAFEIEHSTGVTSGLTRLNKFRDLSPAHGKGTRYIIVAPDEARADVNAKASADMFEDLGPFYFPYSAVEELHSLSQRRKIRGINDSFLESFLEKLRQ
jgi:type II restriction enzyme